MNDIDASVVGGDWGMGGWGEDTSAVSSHSCWRRQWLAFLIELGCTVVCQIQLKDGRECRLDIHSFSFVLLI